MYLLARRRWETTTLPERRANGERLVAARRTKARQQVPMMPYDRADPGPMAPCEVCGRRERVAAFRRHPFQSHVNPTWRCPRHATAPAAEYVCPAYRAPLVAARKPPPTVGGGTPTRRVP